MDYWTRALAKETLPERLESNTETNHLDRLVLDEVCLRHPVLFKSLQDRLPSSTPKFSTLKDRLKECLVPELSKRRFKTVVLSLSGGVDSMVHLLMLCQIKKELEVEGGLNMNLAACHIRHSSRPEEAMKEQHWVQYITSLLDVPCYAFHIEITRPHSENANASIGSSSSSRDEFEEMARRVRFDMYRKTFKMECGDEMDVGTCSCPLVMIGHHLDDVDENRLAELGKGTVIDIDGMNNLEYLDGVDVFRPLLKSTRKSELIEAAYEMRLFYMHNSTPMWSRRGWIRSCIEYLPEKSVHDRLLELLNEAGGISGDISIQMKSLINEWNEDLGLRYFKDFEIRRANTEDVILCNMWALDVGKLFIRMRCKPHGSNLEDLIDKFRCLTEKIAEIWNPLFKEYHKHRSLIASSPVSCPIQPIESIGDVRPIVLMETLFRNYTRLRSVLNDQLPSRTSVRSLCESTLSTSKVAVVAMLHKSCPVIYLKESQTMLIIENHQNIIKAMGSGVKSEQAACIIEKCYRKMFKMETKQ
jgi:tRNA(Ile)-lysidine synthase TilS/MesJ